MSLAALIWPRIRIEEYRDRNVAGRHFFDGLGDLLFLGHKIQAALGGQFLSFFRDQGDHVRFEIQGELDDLLVGAHFQVEFGLDGLTQQQDVPVLDVPPVLPQMDDDACGPGQFADGGGGDADRARRYPGPGGWWRHGRH